MKGLVLLVALVAGCDHVWGLEREETVDADECFGRSSGKGLLQVCTDTILEQEYVLPQDVDTDDDPAPPCTEIVTQEDTARTEVCVIAADTIRVQGAPSLHGGRPVVLVARRTIIVDPGTVIDVATHRGGRLGAGAPQQICAMVHPGASADPGGGGGAGGGFQGPSARGGNAMQANGGATPGAVPIQGVRAGCPGGKGGNGSASGGSGGVGGGALYLIAGERIEVAGVINASGEGGAGGAKPAASGGGGAGGGGGGTGGLIGFDAPLVTIAPGAVLVANGGGGGGGGSPGAVTTMGGSAGEDPVVFEGVFPFTGDGGAGGAALTGPGGAGGHGAAGDVHPTNGGDSNGGGGGGGGAAGYILVYGETIDDTDAVFSPPRGP